MLLTKIKDVLFNRRNKYEIESLDGDIDGLDIKDLVDWVSEMKDLIEYDEENACPTFPSGLSIPHIDNIFSSEDGSSIFPSLQEQAGKVVKVNADETGFEYGEVSGGTKLYEHAIKIDSSVAYQDIFIISTTSEELSTSNVLTFKMLSGYGKTYAAGTGAYQGVLIVIGFTGTDIVFGLLTPEGMKYIMTTNFTDTVTPL